MGEIIISTCMDMHELSIVVYICDILLYLWIIYCCIYELKNGN
jgi:hypothetical protein